MAFWCLQDSISWEETADRAVAVELIGEVG